MKKKKEKGKFMQNSAPNVASATKVCPYCGATIASHAQKCQACGEWLVTRYGNSWVKTYLLCCLLGCFGAHNFYNNKSGSAVPQLILSITVIGLFISIPWVLVDCIMILCNAYTDGEGLKLSKKPTIKSTALCCFFGGASGFHRFYTGHIGLAWLQLFSSFVGIGFIWALVDFIMILLGKFKDADGNYLK